MAAQNDTFNWIREASDPRTGWLRVQELDESVRVSSWSPPTQLNLTLASGKVVIYFSSAGRVYYPHLVRQDYPTLGKDGLDPTPISTFRFTVSPNPTSTILLVPETLPTSQSPTPPSATPTLPPPTQPSASGSSSTHISPDAMIAYISVGVAIILVIAGIIVFCLVRRRRRCQDPSQSCDPAVVLPKQVQPE
ncbi:hypothetical protein L218DRAFT_1004373 [Marasmius fiardii PR-910]|nr:hypothetical protein L218DRAFT_1004373 [Marasmius fiardii PR-910]